MLSTFLSDTREMEDRVSDLLQKATNKLQEETWEEAPPQEVGSVNY